MRQVTIDLYSFKELPRDIQDCIAARWLNLALAYGEPENNGDNEVDLRRARASLETDPAEKYTAEGYEFP